MRYVAVEIGVPNEDRARRLSEGLVQERIAAGTKMKSSSVPGHYRWKGEVHERMYWTVTALTTKAQVDCVYEYIKSRHEDELLPITYDTFEASQDYYEWIESNVESV